MVAVEGLLARRREKVEKDRREEALEAEVLTMENMEGRDGEGW